MVKYETMTARFLQPGHAVDPASSAKWQASGQAQTPGADASCRVFVSVAGDGRLQAGFAAFGPPVVIACADWLCEWAEQQTPSTASAVTLKDIEQALALSATQRYAGLLVMDALANALMKLRQ